MNLRLYGLGEQVATFRCSSDVTSPGQLVKMSSSNSVKACSSGDKPIGVCVGVKNGYAAVQLRGYVEVKQNGTLTLGYNPISALDSTMLKKDFESDFKLLVLYSIGNIAGIFL